MRRVISQGQLQRLENAAEIDAMLDALMATEWVVYTKPCLSHTETVVDYLGRYTYRIGLSDARIRSFDEGEVQLDYKDYRDGGRHKILTLAAAELVRRFLLHVLPHGFMRVRHFGFLANCCRAERLPAIRAAIEAYQAARGTEITPPREQRPFDGYPCPKCRQGHLRIVAELPRQRLEGG